MEPVPLFKHSLSRRGKGMLEKRDRPHGSRVKRKFQGKEWWFYPVVSDERLYLRGQDRLMCYQL